MKQIPRSGFIAALLVGTVLLLTNNSLAVVNLPTANLAGQVQSTESSLSFPYAFISQVTYTDGSVVFSNGITSNGKEESIIGAIVSLEGANRTGDTTFSDAVLTIKKDSFIYFSARLSNIEFTSDGMFLYLNPYLSMDDPLTLNLSNIELNTDADHPSRYIDELRDTLGTNNIAGLKMILFPYMGNISGDSYLAIVEGLISGGPVYKRSITWTGQRDNNLASNPDNWSGNTVPKGDEDIIFSGNFPQDCIWDIDIVPASFILRAGYTGRVILNKDLSIIGDLIIESGTLDLNKNNLDISGNVIIDINGVLDASSSVITVKGNWTNSGTFSPDTSTVVFNGSDQTISGNTTFYNLIKTTTATDTLYFEAGSTQTIANSLILKGISGRVLSLRSTLAGNYWYIDPQGVREVSFVNVEDSYNKNSVIINATESIDSGNNVNWSFDEGECACSRKGWIDIKC